MRNEYNVAYLEALFKKHLEISSPPISKVSQKNYLSDIRYFFGWIQNFAQPQPDNAQSLQNLFSKNLLVEFRDYMIDSLLPIATINRRLSSLRKFCHFLVESSKIVQDPSSNLTNVTKLDYQSQLKPKENEDLRLNLGDNVKQIPFSNLDESLRNDPVKGLQRSHLLLHNGFNYALSILSLALLLFNIHITNERTKNDQSSNYSDLITTRTILFKGKLFTKNGTPLISSRNVLFKMYDSLNSDTVLYSTENCKIKPDSQGEVSIVIGKTCGSPIDGSIFTNHNDLYLGGIIDNDYELKPRRKIPNVGLAIEAESIGGYKPGIENKSIPIIDASGTITISALSPSIKSNLDDALFSILSVGDLALETQKGGNLTLNTQAGGSLKLLTSGLEQITITDKTTTIQSSKTLIGGDLFSGSNITSGRTTLDIAGSQTTNTLCHSSVNGTDNQQIVDCDSISTADFAEMYPVAQNVDYGDIVSLSSEIVHTKNGDRIRSLKKTSLAYDKKIVGVVSNNYEDFTSVGNNILTNDNPMPVALKGRVPVKIAPDSTPITAGDYLTSSSTFPGYAQKATKQGTMIGKALDDWNSEKKAIMVFVNTAWAVPE